MGSTNKAAPVGSETGEFDHDHEDLSDDNRTGVTRAEQLELLNKHWRPLTRKLKIPAAILSPYRVTHPNEDAIWLWYMSIVCEIWFAFSWILDQLPKLAPVNRATNLGALKEKFETQSPENPSGKSDLPGVDVFVSIADLEKEPPLVTANTILSILAADYPVDKLFCYVSDDGGAILTFEEMTEAASFANLWVPFCHKHKIEPRNPESYFSLKKDPFKNKGVRQDFDKDQRRVKREYDEFKVRINGLPDLIRRRSNAYNAREEIKAMSLQKETAGDELLPPVKIPKSTWMADATHWPLL
ncbi:cellulose synthase-like protein D3 [Tanacetum coccineum]|uniref:Cellulose synthase-like protein D3 n=1 Tax=Tanacetum coccineum TaxID=301880 RepID=A0ABQ5CC81_9ASTR